MLLSVKDRSNEPHPLIDRGIIVFFACVALIVLSRLQPYRPYLPAILASKVVSYVPAPLVITPKRRLRATPAYPSLPEDPAVTAGKCLGLSPRQAVFAAINLALTSAGAGELMDSHPFVVATILGSGQCMRVPAEDIANERTLGAVWIAEPSRGPNAGKRLIELMPKVPRTRRFALRAD
jgi:hypothetical protein